MIIDDLTQTKVANIGEALNHHPAFPKGVNVGFVRIITRDEIELRVYEHGAGMTQACGSGACAAVAVLRKHESVDAVVTVHQLGGTLTITCDAVNAPMQLLGSAVWVFEGNGRC